MSTEQLAAKKCIPCRGGVPALKDDALQKLLSDLGHGWRVVDEHHLEKQFGFEDFKQGLDFVNRVGELAEAENHHPDVLLTYSRVTITLWTHKIDGLTESDFILAAKIEQLPR
jgi:4a-hydroxytetrahydrobiopterin dehydratase